MKQDASLTKQKQSTLEQRPPVVVILGHVDHGKTTLLDYIRKTRLADKEEGGITQQIGAYRRKQPAKMTFIDTPGHQTFATMRSRGAQVSDIAVLVVAADDSVMPQTVESVRSIKRAGLPLVVVINKIDLPEARPEKVKLDLAKIGVAIEGYGGEVVAVPISAKTGQGVEDLLEMIDLLAQMLPLKQEQEERFQGVVLESRLDKKRGPLATILVRKGILKVKDEIQVVNIKGRIRALFNEDGQSVKIAFPSDPVQVLGFPDIVPVGEIVYEVSDKRELAQPVEITGHILKERDLRTSSADKNESQQANLRVVLKAESEGALEAIKASLPPELLILRAGIGDITESDVKYAAAIRAIIVGFRVGATKTAVELAEIEQVILRLYNVIYDLLKEVHEVVQDVLYQPKEVAVGRAKILSKFKIDNLMVAGVRVEEGMIKRGDQVKIEHAADIARGKVLSIKHYKIEVNEAQQGQEYGLGLTKGLDFSVSDIIISYKVI